MADTSAQSKEELDNGFETIHLPFQSDIYDKLKISGEQSVNNKEDYYKLCNLYKDGDDKLYSLQNENRNLIPNAIILKNDMDKIKGIDMKNQDGTLHKCAKLFSDIPCDVNNEEDVKEWIRNQRDQTINKDDMLKCMNIKGEDQFDIIQNGGEQNTKHQLLTQSQLESCTKDTTPSDDWWKDENTYVEVKVANMFINVDDKDTIKTSENNDTFQDVYMTWTDYIKLTFDNIDGLDTTDGETSFTNLPKGIRVSLKNDKDKNTNYSQYEHSLRIISYDGSDVTLKVDNPIMKEKDGNVVTLSKQKFMELFFSAGGGGVVKKNTGSDANTDADSKNKNDIKIETKQETKPEKKTEEEQEEQEQQEEQTPKYTIITLKQ